MKINYNFFLYLIEYSRNLTPKCPGAVVEPVLLVPDNVNTVHGKILVISIFPQLVAARPLRAPDPLTYSGTYHYIDHAHHVAAQLS